MASKEAYEEAGSRQRRSGVDIASHRSSSIFEEHYGGASSLSKGGSMVDSFARDIR